MVTHYSPPSPLLLLLTLDGRDKKKPGVKWWEMCYILINLEEETEARGDALVCSSAFIRLLLPDLSSPAGWKSQAAGNGFADGPFPG